MRACVFTESCIAQQGLQASRAMDPSGDELILKLLSQSVTRLESSDRKRKQDEEEVTLLESVKKFGSNAIATNQSDMLESLVVLQYLKEVSPTLAEEFADLHIFRQVSCHLKSVSPELAEELSDICKVKKKQNTEVKKLRNKKTGIVARRFTPQEDEIIKADIENAGEGTINISLLSKCLNRTTRSVQSRIEILERVGGNTSKTHFSLLEDIMLLERLVIPRVGSEKLSEIILQKHQFADLNKQLGKSPIAVGLRWTLSLQPWLLQHYSGTLNLRVERMLANYISDTFTNFSSIDWPEVAARSEFAGHTVNSLRAIYFKRLNITKRKYGLNSDKVSMQCIAQHCELVYGMGTPKGYANRDDKINRQKEVIAFFDKRMTEMNMKNFV